MDFDTLHHLQTILGYIWISVMLISGLKKADGILTRGWRRFFVSECATDDKAEKKADHDERDDKKLNHGLAS
jgi:hypothetical protein